MCWIERHTPVDGGHESKVILIFQQGHMLMLSCECSQKLVNLGLGRCIIDQYQLTGGLLRVVYHALNAAAGFFQSTINGNYNIYYGLHLSSRDNSLTSPLTRGWLLSFWY